MCGKMPDEFYIHGEWLLISSDNTCLECAVLRRRTTVVCKHAGPFAGCMVTLVVYNRTGHIFASKCFRYFQEMTFCLKFYIHLFVSTARSNSIYPIPCGYRITVPLGE